MAILQELSVKVTAAAMQGRAEAAVSQPLLLLVVFTAGMSGLAMEMLSSRLLQPYFGSSQLIWAVVIGLVLIYLAVGYYLGGKLADRAPRPALLYQLVAIAGFLFALIPWIAQPILSFSLEAFKDSSVGGFLDSLLAVVALFAVPMIIMGMVAPFAIRLSLGSVSNGGRVAGSIYALSTVGSIVGTFVPVLFMMPAYGTDMTVLLFAVTLLIVAVLGLLSARGGRRSLPMLLLVVFAGGMADLAMEMLSSRLITPYFGSSQLIWAALIGLVLAYLTIGYYFGGRLADRHPRPILLYQIVLLAALLFALVPLIAQPVLDWSLGAFASLSSNGFVGAFVAVIILFALPITLLGMVSPFATRLSLGNVSDGGEVAGSIYALSTIGSFVGIFVPVLLLIPRYGTSRTMLMFAAALVVIGAIGLLRLAPAWAMVATTLLVGVIALFFIAPPSVIKPAPYGTLVAERESEYNYIQVLGYNDGQRDWKFLALNEGHAIHSKYTSDPNQIEVGGPWDYFAIAPYFNAGYQPADFKSMAMIGSAAGTVSKQITRIYGPQTRIDNVEIDPEIVKVGQQYFAMNEPNVVNNEQDGRFFLRNSTQKYDLIGVDAYRQPYIPFQLTTKEFFQEVRDHLSNRGVAVLNAGSYNGDQRLVEAVANTMTAVFPNVWIVDVADSGNSMVIGTNQPTSIDNFTANARRISGDTKYDNSLNIVFNASQNSGHIRPPDRSAPARFGFVAPFTDDRAPVEQVIDQIILGAVKEVSKLGFSRRLTHWQLRADYGVRPSATSRTARISARRETDYETQAAPHGTHPVVGGNLHIRPRPDR
jgi:predicted membrane-bound spermidine synthase